MSLSYLETQRSKELYLTQKLSKKAENTQINAKISMDWFDKFCLGNYDNRPQEQIITDLIKLNEDGKQQKFKSALFSMMQSYIDYLEMNGHGPDTIRGHLNRVKDYLNYRYIPVYNEDVKANLEFPKKTFEEKYSLTSDDIKKILDYANIERKALYLTLASSGMRISETLQLRKRDFDDSFERLMIRLPGKYTKTRKPRNTFISKEAEKYVKPKLAKIGIDDLVFARNPKTVMAKHIEEDYFYRLRIRAGFVDRYESGHHKITLHTFRSFFITKCNRIDSDFGNALGGHDKYMKQYDRLNDEDKIGLYLKAEPSLLIYERGDSDGKEATELKKQITDMKQQQAADKLQRERERREDKEQFLSLFSEKMAEFRKTGYVPK